MRISMNLGLVFCLFAAIPTALGNASKTLKFCKDVTKLAQAWTGAVHTLMDSFNSYNRSLDLVTYENVTGFGDPLLAEAFDLSLKSLQEAKDAISDFSDVSSLIVNYSNAFRSILFDEGKDIEVRFRVLLKKLSAQKGVIGETCTTLYKGNITNAAAQLTENIKSCADSVVSGSPEPLGELKTFVSLSVAVVDMSVEPVPPPIQCKLDVLRTLRTKYTELDKLVDKCIRNQGSKLNSAV